MQMIKGPSPANFNIFGNPLSRFRKVDFVHGFEKLQRWITCDVQKLNQ